MFRLFKKKNRPEKQQALALYELSVATARAPKFYEELEVPDTVDGRFDLIAVHVALLILRLANYDGDDAKNLSQELFDQMFLDMDRSLREMGIGDLSVPKHMKRMLNGFNGRLQAYREALQGEDPSLLQDAVRRNIYGTVPDVRDSSVLALSSYLERQWQSMQVLELKDFQNAEKIFIEEV